MEKLPLSVSGQGGRSEFRCRICAKILDNRRSQIRHTSYCKKTIGRVKSRKRACFGCAKAKTQCDASYPKCTRCDTNGLRCEYESPPLPHDSPGPLPLQPQHIQSLNTSLSIPSLNTAAQSYYDNVRFSDYLPFDSSPDFIEIAPVFSVDSQSLDIASTAGTDLHGITSSEDTIESLIPYQYNRYDCTNMVSEASMIGFPDSLSHIIGPSTPDLANYEMPGNLDFLEVAPKAPKSFWPRVTRSNQLALNHKFVMATLRSYPYMLVRDNSLPPFIHPYCFMDDFGDNMIQPGSLPESLAMCRAITQMHSVDNKDNKAFIWSVIRMETERLLMQSPKYNDYHAVAALQAMAIYFLLRVSEDDVDATNFDFQLIQTMLQLAKQVTNVIFKDGIPRDNKKPTWQDWLLGESLRRTIIVLFLIDLFVDLSLGLPPQECGGKQLAGMALPCARGLWKASSKSEWEREYDMYFQELGAERELTYGDLLTMRFKPDKALDPWLSRLDDFGMLVMAAASIPDERNNQ